MHNELSETQEVVKMYVLLSSFVEMLNAANDITMLLADMKPLDHKELATIEKHLLNMIHYMLDSYEQALEESLQTCQNQPTQQKEHSQNGFLT